MTIGIAGPIKFSLLRDGIRARVLFAWPFRDHAGQIHTVPPGFVTNFASVPRIFWHILPPWGEYGEASVAHDYLYSRRGSESQPWITTAYADDCLAYLMREANVTCWKRWLINAGLFIDRTVRFWK